MFVQYCILKFPQKSGEIKKQTNNQPTKQPNNQTTKQTTAPRGSRDLVYFQAVKTWVPCSTVWYAL